MTSIAMKLLVSAFGLAVVLASAAPADAKKVRKHKRVADTATTVQGKYRGTDLFPAGPLYYSGVYLGDDPDPNIRFQIWRDISGRFGGED